MRNVLHEKKEKQNAETQKLERHIVMIDTHD